MVFFAVDGTDSNTGITGFPGRRRLRLADAGTTGGLLIELRRPTPNSAIDQIQVLANLAGTQPPPESSSPLAT
ncbi:hypothetical protein D3C85_1888140 [compost metagenome]